MIVEYNKEKLVAILKDFRLISKVSATIYDANMECVAHAPSLSTDLEKGSYCSMIQKDKQKAQLCMNCDKTHINQVHQTKKPIIYTCHAGLIETITPITIDKWIVGYAVLGKFTDSEKIYSSPKIIMDVAKKYNLDKNTMLNLYNNTTNLSHEELSASINLLIICIKYILNSQLITLKNNHIYEDIKQYVLANINEKITIESIAQHFYLSRQSLNSLFHAEYNDSLKSFITNERINVAKNYLSTTDKAIYEISDLCGYIDYNYFIKAFRNKVGISPLKYRKQFKEDAKNSISEKIEEK